ncbi:MAG: Type I restriction-modification system, restriction subunit R [Candidatus Kapaibacterium sp.]|nr:MAG: Type I restriction-modification system, restriction subunit R [Candidatus Kapabacteria bacterium]
MPDKEAKAKVKINNLLEEAGWRFFDDEKGPANVMLETNVKFTPQMMEELGEDFENVKQGFVDYLLLGKDGKPLAVLEAKRENKNPLDGKEQARKYAQNLNVRFVILSNGNIHYFWDIETGNPEIITEFPTQESIQSRLEFKPNPNRLYEVKVDKYYIAETIDPYIKEMSQNLVGEALVEYKANKNIPILRKYQLDAIKALQNAAREGKTRFLFEMATGTGKTLVAAAIIKLFLSSGNAKRVLFLVDRIELENQAKKSFERYLKKDYKTVIYKQDRDDWRKAEIVVTTIQTLLSQNKFRRLFSPIDFDLVISDEAHRSINGNARAVFEYFVGFKLGLTATPKNYLKNIDPDKLSSNDIRAWERRQLLDTYKTFGCESGEPTFRYSLNDGARDGYLVQPIVVDARTEITTELLSEQGYSVLIQNEEGEDFEEVFYHKDFEKKFFSDDTNRVFCETFIENALKDPISGEIGKSIVFCVSQNHASKITQILNKIASQRWPGKYNSDFAVQVTSNIPDAQQFAISFANNNLNGHTRFLENYKSSKTRVCVTVAMMTTGYDCPDILNLVLMRPVFSPTDFIQIKGRGTRRFEFTYTDENGHRYSFQKERFKFFDFFANFEFFEEKFNYDEVLKLPPLKQSKNISPVETSTTVTSVESVEISDSDFLTDIVETPIGIEGMKIDRKFFEKASDTVRQDDEIKKAIENNLWDLAINIIREKYENKPELFITLQKLQKSLNLDRKLTWREYLEYIFGFIDRIKTKNEMLDEECDKFISIYKPDSKDVPYIRSFIKAYISDEEFREIIDQRKFGQLEFTNVFTLKDLGRLGKWKDIIVQYIKDYVILNYYAA